MSRRCSAGFTLVELLCVIVVLGALAAFAVPKFLALSDEAGDAAAMNVAAALTAAGQLNYMKFQSSGSLTGLVDVKSGVADCNTLRHLLQGGYTALPSTVEFVQGSLPYTCSPHGAGGTSPVCMLRAVSGGNRSGFSVLATCTSK